MRRGAGGAMGGQTAIGFETVLMTRAPSLRPTVDIGGDEEGGGCCVL